MGATCWPVASITPFLQRIERLYYDLDLINSSRQAPLEQPTIVLVDIDENTMSQIGGWPRPRKEIADFINILGSYKPKLIGLTTIFDHREINPIDELENKLRELKRPIPNNLLALRDQMDADDILTRTLHQNQVILSFSFHDQAAQNNLLAKGKPLIDPNLVSGWQSTGYSANLLPYQDASGGEGHIASQVDSDGVLRSLPLVMQFDKALYPAFALVLAQHYLNVEDYQIVLDQHYGKTIYQGLQLGNIFIPTDPLGQLLIPYHANLNQIKRVSAADIVNKTPLPILNNAIAIIGSSASSVGNLKSTPIRAAMAEFEIQALALNGILHPSILWYAPDWGYIVVMAELFILCLIMLLWYPRCRPHHLLLTGMTLLGIILFSHYALHQFSQIYISPTTPLLLIISITLIFLIASLFFESRSRAQLQQLFGQYVPSEHIQRIMHDPKAINLEGERREMTVLFADLHDFTQISEEISTQELKQFLNRYLTYATAIIDDYRGIIDKYIGDMIMAFWGAPLPEANHAEQSVYTALALQNMLRKHQHEFNELGVPSVKLGIGINTGEMNVGEMGSQQRRAYTVLGDAVNIASRIEPLTRFYQVDILVTETTKKQCPTILFRHIDQVRVKGKQNVVNLYEPIGLITELSADQKALYALYELGLEHCYAHRWEAALTTLEQVNAQLPNDYVTQLYIQRVKDCIHQPIPYWTGVQDHLNKG
ncbi:CHASE2 domain-containing protein [Thiofilum flexile]|uniref:CHASE2 domain-containing protein n=1 Tax=Thiofilum flexile TaxID=125627 RepID=UPI0013A5899C|nr:adenylate/guanylate cyclase domain-containing protein [Thiofilum flexile]